MQCPSCHQEVTVADKNIGTLFTCPLCQSVYFINFDGTAEFNSEVQVAPESLDSAEVPSLDTPEIKTEFDSYNAQDIENSNFIENNENLNVPSVQPDAFTAVAHEIETFGNQITEVSGLTYDLEIKAIDSKQAMILIKEAVEDPKFGWMAEDILKEVKAGNCKIKGLTPVQAFVLARRLQFIDIEMKWTQNAEI